MTKLYNKFVKADLPNLEGKVFAITGTTSGTGYAAAQAIATKGGEVVLLNRPSQRATDSLAKLQEAVPEGTFVPVECDLQSFASVKKAIAEIKSKYKQLYCLANNAGIMATDDEATEDGYDTQMQTNHLSHFLLTAELFPLLEASAKEHGDARIVNMSSGARELTPNKRLEEKYLQKNGGNLGGNDKILMGGGPFHRYFQTKLANSVFTYALHDKLKEKGSAVKSIGAHPGGSTTALGDHLDEYAYGKIAGFLLKYILPNLLMQSSEDGTVGMLKGMADPTAESGVLYGPWSHLLKKSALTGGPDVNPPHDYELDQEAKEMLWRGSEEATGVKFTV